MTVIGKRLTINSWLHYLSLLGVVVVVVLGVVVVVGRGVVVVVVVGLGGVGN